MTYAGDKGVEGLTEVDYTFLESLSPHPAVMFGLGGYWLLMKSQNFKSLTFNPL